MHGLNDAKDESWNKLNTQNIEWKKGYQKYIQEIDQIKPKPEIYIMSTPPILNSCCETEKHHHENYIVRDVYLTAVKSIADKFDSAHFLDLYTWLGGNNPVS